MDKYKITFTFDDNNSLNDIFIKVLLREVNTLKIIKNDESLPSTFLDEGGNDY